MFSASHGSSGGSNGSSGGSSGGSNSGSGGSNSGICGSILGKGGVPTGPYSLTGPLQPPPPDPLNMFSVGEC